MAIAVACPGCANSVAVSADMAGRRALCPQCRMQLSLPRTLVECPDRGDSDPADLAESPPPSPRRRLTLWLLGIAGVCAVLAIICGGPIGILYLMLRGEREAAALADQVKLGKPGENLPKGAPPRARRVTQFAGVFRTQDQLVQGDVVFKNVNGGGVNNNRVCKEYVIDLEAGKSYVINLDAPNFDAYLRLAHGNGQVIAENDDANGSLNSEIRFTAAETKSYLVVATSLGGGFGPYTLTVRESHFKKPR
jgi:hypothetical protein